MTWADLIRVLKQLQPTGPGGHGHGCGRGRSLGMHRGKLPNQLVTSPESIKFIEDSHIRTERAEKVKEEKDKFCKEALAAKQKRERAAKQGHKK